MTIRKRLMGLAAVLSFAGLLAACDNTIRGIGQDINESADAVEDSTD
jgi:predicted small secreted protein